MDLTQDFNQGKQKKQFKKKEYLKEGGYIVTVKKFQTSDIKEDYKGSPYYEYIIETNDGKMQYIKFWKIKPTDTQRSADFKTKLVKEFLQNCGVTAFDNLDAALNAAVGCRVGVCLAFKEYWYEDRETNEPKISRRTEYKYSTIVDRVPIYKDSYSRPLSNEDVADFKSAHNLWEKGEGAMKEGESDPDLPF